LTGIIWGTSKTTIAPQAPVDKLGDRLCDKVDVPMLDDSSSPPPAVPPRLRRNKRFAACAVEADEEFYANGIFEFNITRLLAFLDADRVRHPVEFIAVASIPDYGGERLNEATIRGADLKRPVLLAEISPGRFNLIDGNHRVARARREGVVSIPARRIRCPDHLPFLTSVRAYESYVEYWNGKVKELQPRQRRRSQVDSRARQ
jgi:hypothetical protein